MITDCEDGDGKVLWDLDGDEVMGTEWGWGKSTGTDGMGKFRGNGINYYDCQRSLTVIIKVFIDKL